MLKLAQPHRRYTRRTPDSIVSDRVRQGEEREDIARKKNIATSARARAQFVDFRPFINGAAGRGAARRFALSIFVSRSRPKRGGRTVARNFAEKLSSRGKGGRGRERGESTTYVFTRQATKMKLDAARRIKRRDLPRNRLTVAACGINARDTLLNDYCRAAQVFATRDWGVRSNEPDNSNDNDGTATTRLIIIKKGYAERASGRAALKADSAR